MSNVHSKRVIVGRVCMRGIVQFRHTDTTISDRQCVSEMRCAADRLSKHRNVWMRFRQTLTKRAHRGVCGWLLVYKCGAFYFGFRVRLIVPCTADVCGSYWQSCAIFETDPISRIWYCLYSFTFVAQQTFRQFVIVRLLQRLNELSIRLYLFLWDFHCNILY